MSIGESIMKMFSPAPAAPVAATPGNIPPGTPPASTATPGTATNGNVPPGTLNADGTPKAEPAPFEAFKDLWEPVKVDPNAPVLDNSIFGKVDPQKFMDAAGKIDFKKIVTPEQLTAIQAGGEGAAQAFVEAMNKVAQTGYAQSAFATTKIVEQAVEKAREQFFKDLPQHIKAQTSKDSLRVNNPILSNPAVQPLISAMEAQLLVKFPQATAPEITKMAENYIAEIGKSFAPKDPAKTAAELKAAKGSEPDWETWLQ